jgi:AcrR family transcriptional regulator
MAPKPKKPRKPADISGAAGVSLPAHQERSRGTRDRLLASAEEAFATRGYEGARIADIAKAAGCSTGAVYFRFKDKEALFAGIVERFAEDARGRAAQILAGAAPDDWKTIVRLLVRGTWDLFSAHRGMFRAVMERGSISPQVFMPVVAVRLQLDAVLAEAVKRSRLGGTKRDLRVRVAMQMITGFVMNALSSPVAPTRADGMAAIDELANAVVVYLES